ncbi:MAG: YbhB/YbcL family Raf kinase inhibitor-like protein [Micromonosporaceae bacterium]
MIGLIGPLVGAGRRAAGRRFPAVAVALAVLSGVVLAACGGSGTDGGTGGGTGTPRPSTSTPVSTAAPSTSPAPTPAEIKVSSPAFAAGGTIPATFSCNGSNTPPPLAWSGLPAGTKGVALVMDDPDAPSGTYTHWVVLDMPATSRGIVGGRIPAGAVVASNSGGQAAYIGPCPPSGTHHYRFTIYAEKTRLGLPTGAALQQALGAIKANAIASGRLTGLFSSG